ncbi:Dihydrofolate synthase/folylpolyglutamate synthase [Buchnera aphidicola (Pterocallis alni)]|uniref:bifunctional tetrahydrofolate synthase/dihydrofolate synthase n=1 Tax=Buchnera aphidicola TaxID=9 RepID=UPI003464D452
MKRIKYDRNTPFKLWLSYINTIYPPSVDFSLERVIYVAKKLDVLNIPSFIFTVTGTNGKGSTCITIEQLFLHSGYTVGLYTSPHLINYYERIRINGKYITNYIIYTTMFEKIELLRNNVILTNFEFITLTALLIFQELNLDVIILEVGIGGRLDPTNIINPNIAVITNINMDHIHILGKNRNDIALEKAGIFRKNISVIIGEDKIPNSIYKLAYYLKNDLYRIRYEWFWYITNNCWNLYDTKGNICNLPISNVFVPNVALGLEAFRISNFYYNKKNIVKAIEKIFIPGRLQTILYHPYIIVDVAHNPHATLVLYKRLKNILSKRENGNIYAIIGMILNKDIKNTVFNLFGIIHQWYYTSLKSDNSVHTDVLKKYLPHNSVCCSSIDIALDILIHKVSDKDIILVFGSFIAVSEAVVYIRTKYIFNNILIKN